MASRVVEQNRSYRRGLVLGLTMAEIAVLIIFCLLLACAFLMSEKEQKILVLTNENNELAQVKQMVQRIRERGADPEKFDELFQELKRVQEQAAKSDAIQAELDKLKDDTKELVQNAQYAKEIKESLKDTDFHEKPPQAVAEALKASGDAAKAAMDKKAAEIEAERLKGQLANIQQKLERLGKGTEMPACWADPKTGKVEYIFRIDLTSTGLIIHDLKLPHRAEEQALLPLGMISFDQELSRGQFSAQTEPLAQWSKNHGCRFFVIARDRTQADEKDVYKTMLRTLEDHFYKFVTE